MTNTANASVEEFQAAVHMYDVIELDAPLNKFDYQLYASKPRPRRPRVARKVVR